jgi:antitoxin VapB
VALSIKSDKADRLARELATVTGESLTDAVTIAIEDRLARERRATRDVAGRLRRVREEMRTVPLLDEPEASSIEFALAESFPVVISAATLVEVSLVAESRLGPQGALAVDQILRHADIELLPL